MRLILIRLINSVNFVESRNGEEQRVIHPICYVNLYCVLNDNFCYRNYKHCGSFVIRVAIAKICFE